MPKCNVVLNGEHYKGDIDTSLFTIVADGGYNMLHSKSVDVFVGDKDSVDTDSILARELIELSPQKDMTDGEFAVDYAIEHGFDTIYLYGVDGGRLDHILTNLGMIARAEDRGVHVVARCNAHDIYFFGGDGTFCLDGVAGRTISIVPFDGSLHIMSMEGLYYTVADYILEHTSSRGMSNVATSDTIRIRFGKGRCFVFVIND